MLQICQLKNFATTNLELVASDAIQILGGMGYMEGTMSERIFRETKARQPPARACASLRAERVGHAACGTANLRPLRQVMQIGGGSTEIMKDLAAKQAQY